MVDSARYKDWLEAGEKDLKSAYILYNYEGDNGIVAFHCQQAIEKMIKGYLLLENEELEKGHSLIVLIKKAVQFDKEIKTFLKDCAYINQFYIETRYPADEPMIIDKEEAKECLDIVEAIKLYIFERVKDLVKGESKSKGNITQDQLVKLKNRLEGKENLTR